MITIQQNVGRFGVSSRDHNQGVVEGMPLVFTIIYAFLGALRNA